VWQRCRLSAEACDGSDGFTQLRLPPKINRDSVFGDLCLASSELYAQNCSAQGIVCKSGTLSSNETWSASHIYVITGSVTIASGVTLTIDTGTIVKFSSSTGLTVGGTLTVNGTADNKVYFTSLADDTIGVDTNGDGGNTTPYRGYWDRIYFNAGSGTVTYAEVRYAGYSFPNYASIYLSGSSPTLSNIIVRFGAKSAISAAHRINPSSPGFHLLIHLWAALKFAAGH
jgi:hypothetical protein